MVAEGQAGYEWESGWPWLPRIYIVIHWRYLLGEWPFTADDLNIDGLNATLNLQNSRKIMNNA